MNIRQRFHFTLSTIYAIALLGLAFIVLVPLHSYADSTNKVSPTFTQDQVNIIKLQDTIANTNSELIFLKTIVFGFYAVVITFIGIIIGYVFLNRAPNDIKVENRITGLEKDVESIKNEKKATQSILIK